MNFKSIEKYTPQQIESYRNTKNPDVIPEKEIQQFIEEIDFLYANLEKNGNVSRQARKLMEMYPYLSFSTARLRVYDAIEIFYSGEENVPTSAWRALYANWYENFVDYCILAGDLKNALIAKTRAYELRASHSAENQINPDDLKQRLVVLTPDFNTKRAGIETYNLTELWQEVEKLVDKSQLDKDSRESIMKEFAANVNYPNKNYNIKDIIGLS